MLTMDELVAALFASAKLTAEGRQVAEVLISSRGFVPFSILERRTGLNRRTVLRCVQELEALRLVSVRRSLHRDASGARIIHTGTA